MQLCLEHLHAGEEPAAFIERVGESQINVLAVTGRNTMARTLRKVLKKLGDALRTHSTLEKAKLQAEIDSLLSRWQSE